MSVGHDAALNCLVAAFPPADVRWRRADGRPLAPPGGRISLQQLDIGRQMSVLLIQRATRADVGAYVCVASNKFGTSNYTVTLRGACPSVRLSGCPSVGPAVCLSVFDSVCVSVRLPICLSLHLPICLPACLTSSQLSQSIRSSVCPSFCSHPSVRPFVRLSVRPSVRPSIRSHPSIPSVRLSVRPSVRSHPSVRPSVRLSVLYTFFQKHCAKVLLLLRVFYYVFYGSNDIDNGKNLSLFKFFYNQASCSLFPFIIIMPGVAGRWQSPCDEPVNNMSLL